MLSRVECIVFCCVLASMPALMLLVAIKSDTEMCKLRLMQSLRQLQIPNFNSSEATIDYVSKQINVDSCNDTIVGVFADKIYDLLVNDFYIQKIYLAIFTTVYYMVWGRIHRDYFGN